jgi:hypothetical protein
VYIFAAKNPTRQITVRFNDPRTEERLHAILDVVGYRLKESQGNTRLYKPSFWIGGLNGKVRMEYAKDRVVITGPLFVIGRSRGTAVAVLLPRHPELDPDRRPPAGPLRRGRLRLHPHRTGGSLRRQRRLRTRR